MKQWKRIGISTRFFGYGFLLQRPWALSFVQAVGAGQGRRRRREVVVVDSRQVQPQEDTSSRATSLVLGPNSPTTRATPVIAPAMNTKTARTPRSRSTPMMRLEKTTLKRLQQ